MPKQPALLIKRQIVSGRTPTLGSIASVFDLPLTDKSASCAAEHFGPWAIEPKWFQQAVARYKAGSLPIIDRSKESEPDPGFEVIDGVAVINITGAMTKRPSSFAGASTVKTRQALRAAGGDPRAESVLLLIDSPGGSIAGVGELARDVREMNADTVNGKPVDAYIDDLGASAAYWVASSARRVFANDTALIGSIGVFTLLDDTSGAMEKEGITVHLVNTGPNKGAFSGTGVPIPESKLESVQREIDGIFGRFTEDVMAGRSLTQEQFNQAADGSVFIADQAKAMGLIDQVGPLESTFQEIQTMNRQTFDQFAQENPDAVAQYRQEGKKSGIADGLAQAKSDLTGLLEAAGGDYKLAHEAFLAGRDAEQVKATKAALDQQKKETAAALKAKDEEIEKLKAQVGEQDPVGFDTDAAASDTAGESDDAPAQFKAKLDENLKRFKNDRAKAMRATVRENPKLHKAYVASCNQRPKAA